MAFHLARKVSSWRSNTSALLIPDPRLRSLERLSYGAFGPGLKSSCELNVWGLICSSSMRQLAFFYDVGWKDLIHNYVSKPGGT
jgi:hypothetical protein